MGELVNIQGLKSTDLSDLQGLISHILEEQQPILSQQSFTFTT